MMATSMALGVGAGGEDNVDLFRVDFKYYKRRNPPPDFSNVIDFSALKDSKVKQSRVTVPSTPHLSCMKPVQEWESFTHEDFPGFTYIRDPFLTGYQWYWIKRCLEDYHLKPNITNLDAHMDLGTDFNMWENSLREKDMSSLESTIMYKLRWVTLGYHHDWNTKKYSPSSVTPIAEDMQVLSRFICSSLDWPNYTAEAAIVNYYHLNSTLAGHTDHSELDHQSPLLSISFGQTALFMLGGKSKETKPITMYLRSGDVVVMEKEARLFYHAVPRILADSFHLPEPSCLKSSLVSTSARQMHQGSQCSHCKETESLDPVLTLNERIDTTLCELDVSHFKQYLKTSRINMNIRQVLPHGATFPCTDSESKKREEKQDSSEETMCKYSKIE